MIRRGTAAEVIDVRWSVLRPGQPRESAIFTQDDIGSHWVDEQLGAIVGVVTVNPSPWPGEALVPLPGLQLRGMAVLPAHRGKGLGGDLLRSVQRELAVALWCNARAEVVGFYRGFGWLPRGELFPMPNVGAHQRMTWTPS